MTLSTALDLAVAGHNQPQTQALVARLDLFDESVILTTFKDGIPLACHEVDPADVASGLSGVPLVTGHLPQNTLFYERAGGTEVIAVYLPPKRRVLTALIEGQPKQFKVPCPPLVWLGKGTKYCVWAVRTQGQEWPKADEALCRPPFPNVFDDGRVCPGNVQFPACGASSIHIAAELFFSSQFDNHLANGRSRKWKENIRVGWAALNGSEAWPLDDLVEAKLTLAKLREA